MKRLIYCLVAVMFLILGCTSRQKINTPSRLPGQTVEQYAVPGPVYPRNENGQTYGSSMYATSVQPDLTLAYGVDGTIGYVRTMDLHGPRPKTPEEALAQQRSNAGQVRQIPLYAADGKTVIGVFNVGPGVVHSARGQ